MSTLRQKPVVGQKLFELYIGSTRHGQPTPDLVEVEVTKVGRKYFTASAEVGTRFMERQYFLSNWMEDGKGYSSRYKLYDSRQERADELESLSLREEIVRLIEHGNQPLAILKQISAIILK